MAITLADFTKIWASTSPLTPYSFGESNYKEGWNFIGSTPPSRQMWDFIQKQNDEKLKYIVDNYLPTAGGTMTGDISSNANASFVIKHNGQEQGVQILSGENDNFDGATLQLFAPQHSTYAGQFLIRASTKTSYDDADATHKSYELTGRPDGTLTWDNKEVERVNSGDTWYIRFESGVQILWGEVTSSTSGKVVTLPVAFKGNSYEVTISASANFAMWVNSWTTTSFKLFSSTEGMVCYIAIGRWK